LVSRTYAEYKGEIYKWNELLDKLNLDNDGYSSGRIQFYKHASAKQLENLRCMIKDEDEEYVEICNDCEELIDDCVCNDVEYCKVCGELIDNCVCEKSIEDCEIENQSNVQVNDKFQDNNVTYNTETLNDKKIITRAQLPNGKIITWVNLLKKFNLHHVGGSAYINWLGYKSRDTKDLLPDVKRVDFNGNDVHNKSPRQFVSKSDKNIIWVRYFGNNKNEGLCPCCKDILNITINKELYIVGHNIPHSKGGTEDIGNLVPICKLCNDGMGNRYTIAEYRKRMLEPTIFEK